MALDDGTGGGVEFEDGLLAVVGADPQRSRSVEPEDGEAHLVVVVDRILAETSSGGVCVNATLYHLVPPTLPFGGVGESGMGAYHGKFGFDTFSHKRGVHTRSTRLDPDLLYPPYTAKKASLIRKGLTLPDPRDVVAKARGALRRK